jgi:hypothetical protein
MKRPLGLGLPLWAALATGWVACGGATTSATTDRSAGANGGAGAGSGGASAAAGTALSGESSAMRPGDATPQGGAPSGGAAGDGGVAEGGGGAGGLRDPLVEYRACTTVDAILDVSFRRIDRRQPSCIRLTLEEKWREDGPCDRGLLDVGRLCLLSACITSDVASCEPNFWEPHPDDNVVCATAATGTISYGEVGYEVDVRLEFPSDSGWPSPVFFQVSGCYPNCADGDCRG